MQYDMSEIMRLAQSPAGQQLMALLQRSGGKEMEEAVSKASAGDLESAKKTISSLLSSPEAQKLLKQLGENK